MTESPSSESLTPQQALVLAVNRIGGQSAMARLCDVRQSTVWEWIDKEKPLPAEHVLTVEAATHVPRSDLRPDIYPRGLQDGVPFTSSEGIAAIGELAGGSAPEWPVTAPASDDAENRDQKFQSAGGSQ
jgi:DNA-binding transcriptional regulator YdaS (Cro superfamily)